MGHARVDQPAAQAARGHRPAGAGDEAGNGGLAGGAEPEEATREAADQRVAVVQASHRRVDDQAPARRERGQRARPPSTGMTAPVMPLLSGPASHTRVAATSSGSSSRSMGCWSAKDWADSRP